MASIGNSNDSVQFFPRRESGFEGSASVTFLPVDLVANMAPPNKPLPQPRQSLETPPLFHSTEGLLAPSPSSEPATVRTSAKLNSFASVVKDVLASGIMKWSPIQNAKLRKNMLEQCLEAKRQFLPKEQRDFASLSPEEIKSVNTQVDTIIKVNSSRKSTFKPVSPDTTKADWTVRKVEKITLGSREFEVHMGRNHKAMIVYTTAAPVIGKGSYGEVAPVGIDVKKGLGVLAKESDLEVIDELKNEIAMTKELHDKAGGFQTGIQRSPYSLRSLEGSAKATVFVHRYETDLFKFKNQELAKYGFTGKHPEAQLVQGLFNGLEAMHKTGMAHRDIKPANSGLQKNDSGKFESCLADFGAAVKKRSDGHMVFGTPVYMSVFDAIYQNKRLTPERRLDLQQKQDVFALGKTALELLTNRVQDRQLYKAFLPFVHDPNRKQDDIETSNPAKDPVIANALTQVEKMFGEPAALMIGRMIHSDPDQRPTIEEATYVINALASGSIKDAPVNKKDPFELTGDFIGRHNIQKFVKQLIKENPNQLSSTEIAENIKILSRYEQEDYEIVSAFEALKDLGLNREHLLSNPDVLQEFVTHFRYKVDSSHYVSYDDLEKLMLDYFK